LIKTAKATPTTKIDGGLLYDALLAPTRIYVKPLLALAKAVPVRSFAHITGGGLTENIPRVIPAGLEVMLSAQTWQQPAVFDWLQKAGSIPAAEMYRTFNCGIGMTVCVAAEHCDKAIKLLTEHGERPLVIGEVRRGDGGVVIRK
jgi:phosphoribosylformylglycinamidine cyclo-ligase